MVKNRFIANPANGRMPRISECLKTGFIRAIRKFAKFALMVFLLAACTPPPTPTPIATSTQTSLPTLTPTETSTPTPVPTATSTSEPAWYQLTDTSYGVLEYRYGLVSSQFAKVYVSLADAAAGTGNYGFLPNAPAYVAIDGEETRDAKTYYATLLGWMTAADVQLVTPSAFRGVLLTRPVDFRFGWVLKETQSVNAAGEPIRTYSRYEIVHEVPAVTENLGFFAVGPDEWLPLDALAITSPRVPVEAGAGVCRFIHVDLSEQVLRVYDECELVFATLVSTGRKPAWTFPYRGNILFKTENTQLTPPPESISVYYLQGVPYFMTYYGDLGFHGAYWHDDFGTPVSHGCVNMSPADARWLYDWAREGDIVLIVRPETP